MRNGLTVFLLLTVAACAAPPPPSVPAPAPVAGPEAPTPEGDMAVSGETVAQPAAAMAPAGPPGLDTVRAGAFDNGKMWTFDAPPTRYLTDAYGFSPDDDWYARARLGALRIPSCSASLVSPNGLVMTNHHCAREFVTQVAREGEDLLDDGFYAATLADERAVTDFEADQLIEIVDVTAEIRAAVDAEPGAEARAATRDSLTEAVAQRMQAERGGEEAGIAVEVVSLYNGGLYSAYVFRRYTNAALVMAPELRLGFFGGEPDNFTYPRYALDVAFLRLLDDDGRPLATGDYFRWDDEGVVEGDLVFIIGNPGSTSRLQTVAELEYRRDVEMPALLGFLGSRIDVFSEYIEGREDEPGIDDMRNELFGLLNSQKAFTGMLRGLQDPYIIARRGAAQTMFASEIEADPELRADYLPLFGEMAGLQARKASVADETRAFAAFGSPDHEAGLILRTLAAFQHLVGQQTGATQEELDGFVQAMREVANRPAELDEALLRARIEDLAAAFDEDDPSVRAILQGRSAGEVAADIIGGNSGSPVVNRELRIVGVVFDGNIQSLPGDYIYMPADNRSVAVDARGILEALDEIYDAGRIVEELASGR